MAMDKDFSFAKDGSTVQKLDILENMMGIKKVYVVLSKNYMAERYFVLEKVDKGMDIKKCFFAEGIERVLRREAF